MILLKVYSLVIVWNLLLITNVYAGEYIKRNPKLCTSLLISFQDRMDLDFQQQLNAARGNNVLDFVLIIPKGIPIQQRLDQFKIELFIVHTPVNGTTSTLEVRGKKTSILALFENFRIQENSFRNPELLWAGLSAPTHAISSDPILNVKRNVMIQFQLTKDGLDLDQVKAILIKADIEIDENYPATDLKKDDLWILRGRGTELTLKKAQSKLRGVQFFADLGLNLQQ